jgi:hypothetical protein
VTYDPRAYGNIWQFEGGTWLSVTGLRSPPGDSSPAVQNRAAYVEWSRMGWWPWLADWSDCRLS